MTAYLGFSDRADLSYFLLSYVFLEHLLPCSADVKCLPRKRKLLQVFDHEDLDDLLPSETMQTKYPTDVGDAATIKENILFKTAGYHYELVKAIQSFTGETSYDGARQEAVMKTIQQQMNLTLPKIPSKTSFVLPKLGPLKGESELESFNRIICLMRFAKKLMTTSNFAIRLGTRSSFKSFQPAISHYPLWMREEQSEDVEPLVQGRQFLN